MERPIILLRLPAQVISKLQSLGLETVEDIEQSLANLQDRSQLLQNIIKEHNVLKKMESLSHFSPVESALDNLSSMVAPVALFHEGLDKLLNGGLPIGKVTELCGAPGSGKTQMCLQFCVDVQVPCELGGLAGEAVFISTDFGFQVERLSQIIQGTLDHFKEFKLLNSNEETNIFKKFNMKNLLNGVHVLRAYNLTSLLSAVRALQSFFENHSNIKIVIIDSFSLLLNVEIRSSQKRRKVISMFLNELIELAVRFKFAVVLTNQLMTVVSKSNSVLKPALGRAYAHRIHQRIVLANNVAYLTKSISHPQCSANFTVSKNGIR